MFTLPTLPYEYDALGRSISADIMRLHHGKHHQAYVDKLNAAVQQGQGLSEASLLRAGSVAELLTNLNELPEALRTTVRNNGGGHYNHSLFWQWMAPNGGGQPGGQLEAALINKYGSFQHFVDTFSEKALGVFGSGWAWLLPDLSITTSPNQDSPLITDGIEPLLGLDVWEHAYYLDYKNHRDDYVKAWWDVVDWGVVSERFHVNKNYPLG